MKNLEYQEQASRYKEKYEEALKYSQQFEELNKKIKLENESTEKKLQEELNILTKERVMLESKSIDFEQLIKEISQDLSRSREESKDLREKLTDQYERESQYKLSLDSLSRENLQFEQRLKKLEEERNNQIFDLETMLEGEKMKN